MVSSELLGDGFHPLRTASGEDQVVTCLGGKLLGAAQADAAVAAGDKSSRHNRFD